METSSPYNVRGLGVGCTNILLAWDTSDAYPDVSFSVEYLRAPDGAQTPGDDEAGLSELWAEASQVAAKDQYRYDYHRVADWGSTHINVTGLTPGMGYYFRTKSQSPLGLDTPWSPTVLLHTLQKPLVVSRLQVCGVGCWGRACGGVGLQGSCRDVVNGMDRPAFGRGVGQTRPHAAHHSTYPHRSLVRRTHDLMQGPSTSAAFE